MSEIRDPDDETLVAQLDTADERADAWRRLLDVAADFAARPHAEDDVRWTAERHREDGVIVLGYPIYGERVERARAALTEVRAVSPAYPWMQRHPLPDGGTLSPADAVRVATATIRAERFSDGTIGEAVKDGTLQAVLASLSVWYRGVANE